MSPLFSIPSSSYHTLGEANVGSRCWVGGINGNLVTVSLCLSVSLSVAPLYASAS